MNDTKRSTPAPLETDPGQQKDDNIDDLGNKPDGTKQDQPVNDGEASDEKNKQPRSH